MLLVDIKSQWTTDSAVNIPNPIAMHHGNACIQMIGDSLDSSRYSISDNVMR